jgi:predicted MFS family arabinose efflux permease
MYLLTSISFGGTFIVFTFLAPILTDITGVAESTVGIALLLFGGATVVGNFAGGRLTDAIGTRRSMTVLLVGLIVSFGLIPVAIHNATAILAVIAVWGVFAFAIPPVMQAGVVTVAEEVAPGAIGTASGMNIAAFNLGISSGSFIGGRLLEGPGLMMTPYAAIVMAVLALMLVVTAMRQPVQVVRAQAVSR